MGIPLGVCLPLTHIWGKLYMAIKITGDNLQYDDTAIASLSANNLTLASGKGLVANNVAASGTLHVTGEAQLQGALKVDGNANMEGTLNVDGASTLAAITATGNAAITGTLHVTGEAQLDGALHVDGNANMEGTLNVDGASSLAAVTATGLASLDGGVNVNENLTISTAGAVAGATSIDGSGDLTMGTITMTGFEVDSDGDVALKSLSVDDGSTIGPDSITDLVTLAGAGHITIKNGAYDFDIAAHDGSNGLKLGGTLVSATAAELNYNDITTLGTAERSKVVTADASDKITLGAFEIEGSNFDIDGGAIDNTVIGANTAAAGTFTALTASSLHVSDVVTFDGEMNFGNASADILTVTGDSQFTGSAQFAGKLHAQAGFSGSNGISVTDGAGAQMTLNDTTGFDLMVASANIQANTAITGTVNVQGAASFSSTLEAEGAVDFESTLNVDGASTFASAKVSDLTSGRVVLAGTDGELEDNSALAFDGTTLTLGSSQDVKARTFITYSDATLKTEIKPLDNAIDKVMSMRGVSYKFKGQEDHTEVGFLAQEMKQSVPEVVYGNGDGNLGIDYAKLTSVLVEAVKSQQEQIEELRAALLKK